MMKNFSYVVIFRGLGCASCGEHGRTPRRSPPTTLIWQSRDYRSSEAQTGRCERATRTVVRWPTECPKFLHSENAPLPTP